MKRKIFSLAIILTFVVCMSVIFVACGDNSDNNSNGGNDPIKASMKFDMDGVEYTYELTDNGETQTFNIKYGKNIIAYDVIKIGEHYNVCGGVADFIIENGALKIYSIGNAIDFITPRSYHVGTHVIDGKEVTLQEDGTFVSPDGNKKYYVVDGNKLVVPDGNGSGVVYSKTVGEYVKVGTFYGESVIYPDATWKKYALDQYIANETVRNLSLGSTTGKYYEESDSGEYEWYYGNVTIEDGYTILTCGNTQKKFSIDEENELFDDAYSELSNSNGEKLRIYYHGKAVFGDESSRVVYMGEKVEFNDGYITIKVDNFDEFIYYVYDTDLNLIINVLGDYKGLGEDFLTTYLKGEEKTKYFFNKIENFVYVPRDGYSEVCEYTKSITDDRIYTIVIDDMGFNAFVENSDIYMYSEVSASEMDDVKTNLSSATEVVQNKWTISEDLVDFINGTAELTTYKIDGVDECVLFIYELKPVTDTQMSSVVKKVLTKTNYTVTVNGDITEYVITDANIVYTLKVQNNEIIEADYTW